MRKRNHDMTYTSHGKKKALGKLVKIGPDKKPALAYVVNDKIVGYEYLEDIIRASFVRQLPEYDTDF